MQFIDFLQANIFWHIAIVAILAGYALTALARFLPRGWIAGILGLVPAIVICVLISALVVLGWIVVYRGVGSLAAVVSDPGGSVTFAYLLGIEFGLVGMAVALITYAIARFRHRGAK